MAAPASVSVDHDADIKKEPSDVHVHAAIENEEYQEYLALKDEFQADRLAKLTRKIDWHVLPQLIIIYLLSYIDRTNIANAKLYHAMPDLGMDGTQWNIGQSVFFITYALGGPPANVALKRFGPKLVLPTLLLCVAITLIGAGVSNNFGQWVALRLLLGLFEAGIFPGCCFTLTTWYTPSDLHSRLSIFYIGGVVAGAFSGLLAFGIGHLDGTWGYHGWRFIYVIEGLVTVVVAVAALFLVHDRPANIKSWLTDEERRFVVLRNQFEYGGNTGGADDGFSWAAVRKSLASWHVWVLGFSFFSCATAVYGLTFSIPTIVANMGFTAANAQLLSCPPYICASFFVYFSGWYSDRYRRRMVVTAGPSAVAFVGLLMAVLSVTHKNLIPLSYIGVCIGTAGLYCLSPSIVAWIGLNQAGQTKRSLSIAIVTFCSQLGGILGGNIYLSAEAPGYPTGFGVSLGVLGAGLVVTPVLYWWAIGRINRKREAMTEEEIFAKYTREELQEMGDNSPLYRYER